MMHDSFGIEFPVLVSIRTEPLPRIVMELISEANRNPVAIVGPELLNEPVVQFTLPFAQEEAHNLFTPVDKLCAVSPNPARRIRERDLLRIAGVPAIFSLSDLQRRGFAGVGRY